MESVVYPGSFDPITNGHRDIIHRIGKVAGKVVVLIANNQQKKYMFSAEERKQLAEVALKDIKNVVVDVHNGLTVDYLKKSKITTIVRGLRAVSDFENEWAMANMNKRLAPNVETMIIFSDPDYYYISSHMVKEVAINGGDVSSLVPENVERALKQKIMQK